jgi:hypothetical protein
MHEVGPALHGAAFQIGQNAGQFRALFDQGVDDG